MKEKRRDSKGRILHTGESLSLIHIYTMQATANTGILIAMFAAVIITSAISAFVGCKMLKKQFEKAGITA